MTSFTVICTFLYKYISDLTNSVKYKFSKLAKIIRHKNNLLLAKANTIK